MATQNKIVEIIFSIKTIYPYYAKETDVESLVKTWCMLLSDVSDKDADAALYQALRTCKMPPTPADLIEQLRIMRESLEPSAEQMWTVYHKALWDVMKLLPEFSYTYVDASGKSLGQKARDKVTAIWEGLPDEIKHYLSSKGELIRQAQQMGSSPEENIQWEKQRFLKAAPSISRRTEYSSFMLDRGDTPFLLTEA